MPKTLLIVSSDDEEIYFKQQEQEQIRALREKAEKECTERYCQEHKDHCFRCGTNSLVAVKKGDVMIDICVNDGCGAVHLDPGELEAILSDKSLIKNAKKSIFDVFKK